jgi:hypothetical protein
MQEAGRGSAIRTTNSLDESVQDASPAREEKGFGDEVKSLAGSNFVNWAGRVELDSYDLPRGMEQPGSSRGS